MTVKSTLALTNSEQIARIKTNLRVGAGFILAGGARQWLVLAAESLSGGRLDGMHEYGAVSMIITGRRAQTLSLWSPQTDYATVAVPNTADFYWVQAMADPSCDLNVPLKGPFGAGAELPDGVAKTLLDLCKSAYLLPSVLVVKLGRDADIGLDTIAHDILQAHLARPPQVQLVSSARVPLAMCADTTLHTYRPDDGSAEHYAIEIGQPARDSAVLVRLHSACFTGDLLGSLKCDCGAQLNTALNRMVAKGAGVLLYMNQEGRGIGLANKMRAYRLQSLGFDTVEANHRLGFEDDERDFALGAQIIRALGFGEIHLMTNNPLKAAMMSSAGVLVREQVPLRVGKTAQNADYLHTKATKSGHVL